MSMSVDPECFSHKVVLVTGASSGIGQAVALRLAARGVKVGVAGRSTQGIQQTLHRLQDAGGHGIPLPMDVGIPEQVEGAVAQLEDTFGGLDWIVCAAGISPMGSVLETSFDLWQETLRVDLTGVFLTCKAGIPALIRRGGGAIVTIAGTLGLYAMPQKAAYCAAKAGVVNLTRQMAIDYGKQGIRINCICPGFIETPINADLDPVVKEHFLGKLPLPRAGSADDVASTVLFLLSEASTYTTGAVLSVDGGQGLGLL
ncbi:SDR family NAD(P)-dependent oxidoreductase [Thermostichus vulcanus]|uniref:SDR family oxidoreductase n=1 Tax=Thermostichus vulcanus str. 'Rupite' TaxID=2813851 RepID=A0ABT0CC11_THEVL|nr:SDR family NAD(P)-dependent oxidoreductase [Thermostichus vulcanus]MCJ2543318.1 SDR family oxidoreductase [Thermostichus vulcanus str. 'Rupite']